MKLKKLTFVIVTHVYATGPAFTLEKYLVDKVNTLIFIGHPFSYTKDNCSFLRVYHEGRLVTEKKFLHWYGPELTFYIKDVLLTLWWILKLRKKCDYYIGSDNLNAFSGYLLKVFGRARKVVFYTIDYIPKRFNNRILNSFYHFLDRLAVKKSDKVWNLSEVMVKEREKRGVNRKYRDKQIVIPIGTDISIAPLPLSKINRYKIVFMGHLREGQGVEMLVAAVHDVTKSFPKVKLFIVGGGPLEKKLKKQVEDLNLKENIFFSGFIKDFSTVQKLLQDAAFAIAPYVDDETTYTRYTDPGKPKDYLASGLPVVITKVPHVAFEIEKKKCGIAINYDKEELIKAITSLLRNDSLLLTYRRNAIKMAKEYTWDKVFEKAIRQTL